jgi:hypothetical protein
MLLVYNGFENLQYNVRSIMGRFLFTGIIFGVFMTEALIHYNMGRAKENDDGTGGHFHFEFPRQKNWQKLSL